MNPATTTLESNQLYAFYSGNGTVPDGKKPMSRHEERGHYLADQDLRDAVRTAVALEKPLLVTGEPGTGKTALAWSIASELGLGPVLEFHTRSDNKGVDLLYSFDHMARFFDAQNRDPRAQDASHYVRLAALGRAIVEADMKSAEAVMWRARFCGHEGPCSPGRRVVLVDEIDKAPRDFPNDLLDEVDAMSFSVREHSNLTFRATYRPIVVITSNSERQLPDPFLRRCVFHHIEFPTPARLMAILQQRITETLPADLIEAAVEKFLALRKLGEQKLFEKSPATAELEAWVRMLILADVPALRIAQSPLASLSHVGALVKTKKDRETLRKYT
jgi:MoxR-like ATPase